MSRLEDEIKKFQEEFASRIPADFAAAGKADIKRLSELKISENALQVGDKAADFVLPNALGNSVSLYETLEDNDFVLLNFYRGVWCPYCNLEMNALRKINDELNTLNTKIIAISPETPDLSLSIKEKHDLEFEVLSDTDYKVEKEYGLIFSLSEKIRPFYESFGIDIPKSTNNNSYDLPMPATYLVSKNKEIVFAFIDEDYKKRCEPQDILDAVKNNK